MRILTALEEKSIRETLGYLVEDHNPISLLTAFSVKGLRYYLLSMTDRYMEKSYIMVCPALSKAVISPDFDLRIGKVTVSQIE